MHHHLCSYLVSPRHRPLPRPLTRRPTRVFPPTGDRLTPRAGRITVIALVAIWARGGRDGRSGRGGRGGRDGRGGRGERDERDKDEDGWGPKVRGVEIGGTWCVPTKLNA